MCLLEKELIETHIYPEHLYKKLYDVERKFIEVHTQLESLTTTNRRKGLRDDSILCYECDSKILGKLDDYAAKVFWGYRNQELSIREVHSINDPRVRWKQADNLDGGKMKLFLQRIMAYPL